MSENKSGKYLKYAIGEIVLVVIGILIALSINNWNEEKKNKRIEASILQELNNDFVKNELQFINIKQIYKTGLEATEKIISFIPFEELESPVDSFYKYRHIAFKTATFDAANGTVESIISSSSFTYIRNDTLRNYLLSWKDVLRDYKEEEATGWVFLEDEILPFEYTYFDKLNELNPENIVPLKTLRFKNLMVLRRISLKGILMSINDAAIENTITEIIRLTKIRE
jgi:hypothetical protein